MKAIDIAHAQIGSVSSRVDGSIAFRVITPELTLDNRATILGLHGINVRVMLEPLDVATTGIDKVETEMDVKTPCQRLRGVLFVHFVSIAKNALNTNDDGSKNDFETFYRKQMDRIIEGYKGKNLPEV